MSIMAFGSGRRTVEYPRHGVYLFFSLFVTRLWGFFFCFFAQLAAAGHWLPALEAARGTKITFVIRGLGPHTLATGG